MKEKEGATIGTYETNVHDRTYDIEIPDQSLANLTPPSKQIAPKTVSYKNLSHQDKISPLLHQAPQP